MATIEDLARLESVIASNVNLDTALAQPHIFPKAREKITRIFSALDNDEKKVFLSLISRYNIHRDYGAMTYKLIPRIISIFNKHNKIALSTPYIEKPESQKSAGLIAYEIRAQLVSHDIPKSKISILDIAPSKKIEGPIVIVDDFSGSGLTIKTAARQILDLGHKAEELSVSVLYGMRRAISEIESLGIHVDAALSGTRCLTDHTFSDDEGGTAAPTIYDRIEARLGVNARNLRGFDQSEALVSMKTTPNNTLPIFWYKGQKSTNWPCPFPR